MGKPGVQGARFGHVWSHPRSAGLDRVQALRAILPSTGRDPPRNVSADMEAFLGMPPAGCKDTEAFFGKPQATGNQLNQESGGILMGS